MKPQALFSLLGTLRVKYSAISGAVGPKLFGAFFHKVPVWLFASDSTEFEV